MCHILVFQEMLCSCVMSYLVSMLHSPMNTQHQFFLKPKCHQEI